MWQDSTHDLNRNICLIQEVTSIRHSERSEQRAGNRPGDNGCRKHSRPDQRTWPVPPTRTPIVTRSQKQAHGICPAVKVPEATRRPSQRAPKSLARPHLRQIRRTVRYRTPYPLLHPPAEHIRSSVQEIGPVYPRARDLNDTAIASTSGTYPDLGAVGHHPATIHRSSSALAAHQTEKRELSAHHPCIHELELNPGAPQGARRYL